MSRLNQGRDQGPCLSERDSTLPRVLEGLYSLSSRLRQRIGRRACGKKVSPSVVSRD